MRRYTHLGLVLLPLGLLLFALILGSRNIDHCPAVGATGSVVLEENAVDESAGGLDCYRIRTASTTYYLEKSGAGLSSLIDRDGNDWLSFLPQPGTRSAGEFRGFPNAVHQQAGNYFHPRNQGTDESSTKVDFAGPDRVTISAVSANQLWTCRFDFHPGHCTFTMTGMPPAKKYWVLYEGTPGGRYDEDDWWVTSGSKRPSPLSVPHQADIPAPEWIVFGDRQLDRGLLLVHHEDDPHPDWYYGMDSQMTVFGFGRKGLAKYLDTTPQRFSIALIESRSYSDFSAAATRILEE